MKSTPGAIGRNVLHPDNRWFRAKVQAALDDPRPNIPHDQVMAEMRALLQSKRNQRDAG
ncbi:type II toxin-antitoxin system RelB family antitoxin [Pseudomonas serbica]